jgi:SAM-dependent methyltransferase
MSDFAYAGGELGLFAKAVNWKRYWFGKIQPLLTGDVVEVGAGIGANAPLWAEANFDTWLCLEPDAALAAQIPGYLPAGDPRFRASRGTIADLAPAPRFQAILYIDVLEHIENDGAEMQEAASHLAPGGRIIVLAPAHPWLYTPFDRAIGHFRRYTRQTLAAAVPAELVPERLLYLDSVGMLASLANRWILSQSMPTEKQILMWDGWLVPPSRWLDPVLGYAVGKSILGVWRKAR